MSLTVSITQFQGGVTEIPPSLALKATSNYLWELMGKYGIGAMKYTGGGMGVIVPGGTGIVGTGKIPYKLEVTITGDLGVDQGSIYQNNELINAVDLYDFLINNTVFQRNMGSFTFNFTTGTINIAPLKFFGQDKLVIEYSKFINTSSTVPGQPLNTVIYFTDVAEYDLLWTPSYIAQYGKGADFSVEILDPDTGVYSVTIVSISPNDINETTTYHFDFGGVSTGRIIF